MGLKIFVYFLIVASFILQPALVWCQAETTNIQELVSVSCEPLLEYLRFGRDNSFVEMRKLQSFLQTQGSSNAVISGVFDVATFEAVKRFQEKYALDILAPWGINVSTGYVFITTKHKINDLLCGVNTPLTENELNQIADTNQILGGLVGETVGITQIPDILGPKNIAGLNENALFAALVASFSDKTSYWFAGIFVLLALVGLWLISKQFFMAKKKAPQITAQPVSVLQH